jgi:hypothetical protein
MGTFWDQVIAALIGAVVTGSVNLGFDYLKKIKKNKWRRILLYVGIGAVVGLLLWSLLYRYYQKTLWTFDQGPQSWKPLSNPGDAAMETEWDLNAKALRAEYNFAQTAPDNPDPRATFYYDNFNDTWSGYRTFNLDATNPDPEHLEITFSVDIEGCFHEFGVYRNLSPGERTTVSLNFTQPEFKTCQSPGEFDQPLDTTQRIERLYLIIGTNESPADFDGAILIDNIRLQKDVWFLRIALGLIALILVSGIALIEYLRYKRTQKRRGSSKKRGPDAQPSS